MKVWVLRRRSSGEFLREPIRVGAIAPPFELLVVEVTDQGTRRPSKVARLYAPGSKAIVAELVSVSLLWLKGFEFVLHGVEVTASGRGAVHAAQSWMCKLDEPFNTVGFRVRPMFEQGRALAHRQVMDQLCSATEGRITIVNAMDERLGRNATCAQFGNPYKKAATLLDCDIDWMGEDRFQLSGFQHYDPYGDEPTRLLRQGWLVEFDIQTPEQIAFVRSLAPKPQR